MRPATRAGGKLSLRARVKALSRTRLAAASDRWEARLPSRMVVLALMGGSSSTCHPQHLLVMSTDAICITVSSLDIHDVQGSQADV